MAANGQEPGPTPHRWILTISWAPARKGIDGLHEVLDPVVRLLSFLDRPHGRGFVVRIGTLDVPEGLDELDDDP